MKTEKRAETTLEELIANVTYDYVVDKSNLGESVIALATAVAHSVLNKCIDPQRNTATTLERVSNNGLNPALIQLKRDIARDSNSNLVNVPFGDGLDLVNTAVVAILEQLPLCYADLEEPYTVRRINKHVVIQDSNSAKYEETETTGIQEVYRAVRRAIADSRAVATDPRSKYCYIEDLATDPETGATEQIYLRLGKFADLGGYETDINGNPIGNYTADRQTADDMDSLIAKLNLTDRQAVILKLRLQGYGEKAIASYLGVSKTAVQKHMRAMQEKAKKSGLKNENSSCKDNV